MRMVGKVGDLMVLKDKCIRCHAPRVPIAMKLWNGNGFDALCVHCSNVIMEWSAVGMVIQRDIPNVYHQILGGIFDEDSGNGN